VKPQHLPNRLTRTGWLLNNHSHEKRKTNFKDPPGNQEGGIQKSNQLFMTQQEQRQQLFDAMTIRDKITKGDLVIMDNVEMHANAIVGRILLNRDRYETIAHKFPNPGLKWWLIAIIHHMECSLNFNCYLGNGQPWNQRTTIVPKGRGAFKSFEEGAIDAITFQGLDKVEDWSIGNVLYILEGYNGYGYSLYRGINTPYLWSGTNQYTSGKYIFDGTYKLDAVSNQIGAAVLLKKLLPMP
jgi:lysozyme family protein